MTLDELTERWCAAVRSDVRERLVAMSDDEFVADAMFRIGVMTSDVVRSLFAEIVVDEVYAAMPRRVALAQSVNRELLAMELCVE